jgi:hypothetical protein
MQIRELMKRGERFEGKADGDGLYLRFRPSDSVPRWLFRYRFGGKARVLDFGAYASASLADARRTVKEMKARVQLGYDPAEEKQERKRVAVAKIEAKRAEISMGDLADMYFTDQILGRWKFGQGDCAARAGAEYLCRGRPSAGRWRHLQYGGLAGCATHHHGHNAQAGDHSTAFPTITQQGDGITDTGTTGTGASIPQ